AEYRPVILGPQAEGLRVVREGLKPGERIIVNGLQRVRPGAPVTPQMVAMDFDPLAANVAKPEAKKEDKIAAVTTGKAASSKE
ncbi:MAG: efflux transporter periplasmic adaptor subunit, partial [Sphingomonadaceae bacterium]